jgi:predicted phosphoribosyltransferase
MADIDRFRNRAQAGKLLAEQLREYAHRPEALVLALPRGGVPVGFAIAMTLALELDVLLVRKLGLPGHEEFAMGAVAGTDVRVLQAEIVAKMGIPLSQVEAVAAREMAEIARRERLYRAGRPPPDLKGRIVILADDGLATGSTMRAAARLARRQGAALTIAAVPVGPPETVAQLACEVDRLVCLQAPPQFHAVSQWYREFDQTSDEEVQDLLAIAWRDQTLRPAPIPKPTPQPDED